MSDEITRRTFIGATATVVLAPIADAQQTNSPGDFERKTLTAAIDCIIPAGGKMPPASAVGVAGYLERLSAREPELAQQFSRALAALGADFSGLRRAAAGRGAAQARADGSTRRSPRCAMPCTEAYYTNPAIWPRLGYTFRKGPRKTADLEPFDPGQLARVQQLPKMYRDAD